MYTENLKRDEPSARLAAECLVTVYHLRWENGGGWGHPPFCVADYTQISREKQTFHCAHRARNEYNQLVMTTKKLYIPPRLTAYDPNNIPGRVKLLQAELLAGACVPPIYTTVLDQDRRYVEVSENFSELLGYKAEELIGTRYDHLTALNTADIPTMHNLFFKTWIHAGPLDVCSSNRIPHFDSV